MKGKAVRLCLAVPAALALAACGNGGSSSALGGFDPLGPPGGGARSSEESGPTTAGYRSGQFVFAAMDGTAFFDNRPRGAAETNKFLDRGERMRVISSDDIYIRVELDNGEVGYVPMVMVTDPDVVESPLITTFPDPTNEVELFPGSGSPSVPPAPPLPDPDVTPQDGPVPAVIDPADLFDPSAPPVDPDTPTPSGAGSSAVNPFVDPPRVEDVEPGPEFDIEEEEGP